jgi:WD40 repeat protein
VWDAYSGAELLCLHGHAAGVSSVSISADGRRLASGARDRTVRVWDAANGVELLCLRGHSDQVVGVSFSADGLRLTSRSEDQEKRIWDVTKGTCLKIIPRHLEVPAPALEPKVPPWRASAGELETVIQVTETGTAIAWYPECFRFLCAHPSGRAWAGNVGNHVSLITLEGRPPR